MRMPFYSQGLCRFAPLSFAVCLVLVGATVALVQGADATTTKLKTFATPGTYRWKVPTGVTTATFTVYGASGGGAFDTSNHMTTPISKGGLGGEAKATFTVHAGEVFEIVVGGQGGSGYVGQSLGQPGSNGGGAGVYGGGGGGGSDVRLGGRGNTCATTMSCGYGDRIIVGGGGGGGDAYFSAPANGLSGGGLTGAGPTCPSGGSATQECGGHSTNPDLAGRFGIGGDASLGDEAGGGGGWYGGGGTDPGGGGSGYISPFAKSGSFPRGTKQGDGKVIITTP